jgi:outer membrane immunogenic protein
MELAMRFYLTAALMAGTFATPAFAQDAPPPPSMSGFRIEGLVGYDSTEINDDNDGGVIYGVGAGYDFQAGRAVFGIEAEASDSTNRGCIGNVFNAGDSLCARTERDLYVGGRAGAVVGRNILLYAKAGYTNARFQVDYDDGTAGGASNLTINQNLDGVRVGLGVQLGIGRNAYIRTEARYSNYEAGSDRGGVVGAFGFRF